MGAIGRISPIAFSRLETSSRKNGTSQMVSGADQMFSRREGDHNPRRFWSWFAAEHQGLANSIEALARGEADAEWALIGLTERIHRYDPTVDADIFRNLDGTCQMVSDRPGRGGRSPARRRPRLAHLDLRLAPCPGRCAPRARPGVAPRPSSDATEISAYYEAYAS